MANPIIDKSSSILIVGAGTFGLSTALELARDGYTNIHCFDNYECPSPIAAGNDSNKIFDYDVHAPDEQISPGLRIRLEARDQWKADPIYSPFYHPVGFIFAACSEKILKKETEKIRKLIDKGIVDYEYLDSPEKFSKHIPVLKGELPGWKGYKLNKDDGWLHARNSLKSAYEECKRLGVKFTFGEDGNILDVLADDANIASIVTRSGKTFAGDRIVITAGANAVKVLSFEKQLQAKCFTLAHFKVTEEEAEIFKGSPVMFNLQKGFFFEADENLEIKVCNEFPGYTNLDSHDESIPWFTDEIPVEAEEGIREYLRETLPQFADRPFVKTRSCWCTDSPNRELIICEHPKFKNVVLGSGDSGKSFMLMPVIGKYISKVAIYGQDGLSEEDREFWKWRPETASDRDDEQSRYGGSGKVSDVKDIKKWVSASKPTPHEVKVE
ncbi:unnamed protein product [Kuraishia capsulata CBS 1993]|uniref:FAD dependent oxidoreductase domain-containing protein n=1 Tax=Kuraishia capsulata CBS 1993 TaxID=1382522 RepID=W6MTX2_9ASCO|nr:uncharacterized protein KUCA_T00001262001 [Kuraishia capsulata CBS 1993]CDK25295.1 unnamed protein product [Kuraishia capsulata CBS 1993]